MAQNRPERQSPPADGLPLEVEVLRRATESARPKESEKEEREIPLVWRVFGGTVLSITALVVMTAYQSLSGNLADLGRQLDHIEADARKEMGRLGEMQGDLVRKDECDSRFKGVWTSLNALEEDRKGIAEARGQCASLLAQQREAAAQGGKIRADLREAGERRAATRRRDELRDELARLRERLAGVEGEMSHR